MILTLVACGLLDDPRSALQQAETAWTSGDLEAFEAVVDVDAVAPVAAASCLQLVDMAELDDRQFQNGGVLSDLGRALSSALVIDVASQAGETAAANFRAGFGTRELECPNVMILDRRPTVVSRGDGSAIVGVAVLIEEHEARVDLTLRREESWRIVGLETASALVSYRDWQLDRAQERALVLSSGLSAKPGPDQWAAVRSYLRNHPEASAVKSKYDATHEPLVGAVAPLTVQRAWFEPGRGLFGVRRARAEVLNPTGQAALGFTVRHTFSTVMGEPVLSTGGRESLQTSFGELGSGEAVALRGDKAGRLTWPADSTEAVVVQVRWADGSTWTHPAVEAGAWSLL